MIPAQIEQKVREILANKFSLQPSAIKAESRLAEDLGIDSFGAVEVMFEVEESFGLKIPDSEIQHVRTVGDIVAYLAHWMGKGPVK